MDGMRFRSLCANVDRLSMGQLRELRRKLRGLESRIRRDAVLCSDGDGAHALFARAHGLPHYRLDATRGPKVIQAAFHIQTVNNLHSRSKAFMRPFCGSATKNLTAYIAWFIARLADQKTAQDHAWPYRKHPASRG